MFTIDDRVVDHAGNRGTVVPIPMDYTLADPDDKYRMARLVYVRFDQSAEAVLIPESRLLPAERIEMDDLPRPETITFVRRALSHFPGNANVSNDDVWKAALKIERSLAFLKRPR